MEKEQKKDSKQEEAQTSSEESTEKKESSEEEEGTSQKTYTEEDIKKLEKKASDFDALTSKLAEEKRQKRLAEFSETKTKAKSPQNDNESEDDDYLSDQRKVVQEEIAKIESKKTEQSFNNAIDKFVRNHPEYSPENDILDVNWKKIKPYIDELKNGIYKGNEEGYLERLEMIHGGITKTSKSENAESKNEEKAEDSGVGNISSQPQSKKEEPDALSRPLNKFEMEAAKNFPGKTQDERMAGYRKYLAEAENQRKKSKERKEK